ncbi:DUF2545 family protein [Escherichia coli]|uniref:DUF2545 family protein n=1 Tax=Escherichia coli TaxID=562 RepID=UPI001BAFC1F1|nr:DUF2545 family protein [Escherichia coli]
MFAFSFWLFFALFFFASCGYVGCDRKLSRRFCFFSGMGSLVELIFYLTLGLTGGNELMTGIFMFLAPACGLMIRFMVGYGRR